MSVWVDELKDRRRETKVSVLDLGVGNQTIKLDNQNSIISTFHKKC